MDGVRVTDLVRQALDPADPLRSLEALPALRSELDQIEAERVDQALDEGASWRDIAQSLQISRQAAHKRHRDRPARKPQPGHPAAGARPRVLITGSARATVQMARSISADLGDSAVGSEHLLLAVLDRPETPGCRALMNLGVTREEARAALKVLVRDESSPSTGEGTFSSRVRLTLERSLGEAVGRGDGYIDVEHLLLAMLRDGRSGANAVLEHLGTNAASVRAELDRVLWEPATPPPPSGERATA